jgi:DNA-binding CsgD family transcriptional regulator
MKEGHAVVNESDARAMVRLVGEVAASEGPLAEKRRSLMDGLTELVEADTWMWTAQEWDPSIQAGHPTIYEHGGMTDAEYTRIMAGQSEQLLEVPAVQALAANLQSWTAGTVRIRGCFADQQHYRAHPWVRKHVQGFLEDLIISLMPLEQGKSYTGIGIHRRWDREPFTDREAKIVHIISSEVRWLHESIVPGGATDTFPSLTPRQRQVQLLLMDGHPVKRVAHLLGISYHTADGYMKQLYQHYGVSSRAEMMRRFMHG